MTDVAERVALQHPNEIKGLERQPDETHTIDSHSLLDGLANLSERNPHPVVLAVLSSSGRTVSYACEWCGGRHRHRATSGIISGSVTSKQQHCRVWRRLHPDVMPDSVRLVLERAQ